MRAKTKQCPALFFFFEEGHYSLSEEFEFGQSGPGTHVSLHTRILISMSFSPTHQKERIAHNEYNFYTE
jgi:hypothetical protein